MTTQIERRLELLENPTGKRPFRAVIHHRDASGNCWRDNGAPDPSEDENVHIVVFTYGEDGEGDPPPEEMAARGFVRVAD